MSANEYSKGYNDGYHRAMLDYGLEDDLNKWEQIRAEIQHLADLEILNIKLVLQIIDKHLNVSEVWER